MATLYCADSGMKSAALSVFMPHNGLILMELVLVLAF